MSQRPEYEASDFLSKQTPLSKQSDEWGRLEYLLKLSLSSTGAKVVNAWAVGNPHLTMQFEKKTQGQLILDSWVDATCLTEHNSVSEVCTRGFRFPPQGMVFPTGAVVLPEGHYGSGRRLYEFILCKTGVGRSYCLEEGIAVSARPSIPEGYNSVYLHKEDDQNASMILDQTPSTYHHEYLLLDPSQVLPLYLIHFEFDADADSAGSVPICDVCNENSATLFCREDQARLCDECDEEVHSANKLVARHIRVPLHEQPQSFGSCATHNLPVEFFCPVCQIPVCVHCKMIGSHSSGEAAAHKLVSIGEAYQSAVGASNQDDPVLDSRRQAILNQLNVIDDRLKDVNRNSQAVEEAIYSALQEALSVLKDQTQKKMGILLGDELELRRQLEQMDWMEGFLRMQQRALSPVDFLNSWNRHTQMRGEVHAFNHFRAQVEVQPDLKLIGSVDVVTEEHAMQDDREREEQSWARGDDAKDMAQRATTEFRASLFRSGPGPEDAPTDSHSSPFVKRTADLWTDALRSRRDRS